MPASLAIPNHFAYIDAVRGFAFLGTIPLATITLHLVENPGIELGRRCLKALHFDRKSVGHVSAGAGLPDAPESPV